MSTEKKICSICGCEINGFGNNPYPINNGRCCDACNQKVIEMRVVINSLSKVIDEMVDNITYVNNGQMFYFTYRDKHYAFGIYKNGFKKLSVEVVTNSNTGWGVYSDGYILRNCIHNYLDYNHKDKKLGKIRKMDGFFVTSMLHYLLAENMAENKEKVA